MTRLTIIQIHIHLREEFVELLNEQLHKQLKYQLYLHLTEQLEEPILMRLNIPSKERMTT